MSDTSQHCAQCEAWSKDVKRLQRENRKRENRKLEAFAREQESDLQSLRAENERLKSENALMREKFEGIYLQGPELEAVRNFYTESKYLVDTIYQSQFVDDERGRNYGIGSLITLIPNVKSALSLSAPDPDSGGCVEEFDTRWYCSHCSAEVTEEPEWCAAEMACCSKECAEEYSGNYGGVVTGPDCHPEPEPDNERCECGKGSPYPFDADYCPGCPDCHALAEPTCGECGAKTEPSDIDKEGLE